ADRKMHGVVQVLDRRFRQDLADPLGKRERMWLVGGRQQKDKFFAAITRENIGYPRFVLANRRQRAQHLVAGQVSIGVVDVLKIIDVEDDDRKYTAIAVHAS